MTGQETVIAVLITVLSLAVLMLASTVNDLNRARIEIARLSAELRLKGNGGI